MFFFSRLLHLILRLFPPLTRYSLFDTLLDFHVDLSREKLDKCCVIVLDISLITAVNFVAPH